MGLREKREDCNSSEYVEATADKTRLGFFLLSLLFFSDADAGLVVVDCVLGVIGLLFVYIW